MKSIAKVWTFKSSSSDKTYQTLLYADGSTSCDCPGWTRRCANGQRTCRHTRDVDLGRADSEAINFHEYEPHKPNRVSRAAAFTRLQYGNRKLCI